MQVNAKCQENTEVNQTGNLGPSLETSVISTVCFQHCEMMLKVTTQVRCCLGF